MPDTSIIAPHFREAGSGRSVVCLHANAGSSAQWRGLMELLAIDHHVFAPDLYGAGKSLDWESPSEIALDDEVRFIEPVLALAEKPFCLVGHSYGGAVALIAALRDPGRVRALVLYEPTLFSVVANHRLPAGSVQGIQDAVSASSRALAEGDREGAAGHFIDYWMGAGSWQATPPARRGPIADAVVNVRRWRHALFTEPTTLGALSALHMPILYLLGGKSPESAQAVARQLLPVLHNVRVVHGAGWGHMAPITHAEAVNSEIAAFVRAT